MAIYRCPKHDVVFSAVNPPTQDGHKKCPQCSPAPKDKDAAAAATTAPSTTLNEQGQETV